MYNSFVPLIRLESIFAELCTKNILINHETHLQFGRHFDVIFHFLLRIYSQMFRQGKMGHITAMSH